MVAQRPSGGRVVLLGQETGVAGQPDVVVEQVAGTGDVAEEDLGVDQP
jgi:hypothetical protein